MRAACGTSRRPDGLLPRGRGRGVREQLDHAARVPVLIVLALDQGAPPAPRAARVAPASPASRAIASASAAGSSGGTSRPVSPSRTSSGTPETAQLTTGRPVASASMNTVGMPSMSPVRSRRHGMTKTCAASSARATSSCGFGPGELDDVPGGAGARSCASSTGRSGPSPISVEVDAARRDPAAVRRRRAACRGPSSPGSAPRRACGGASPSAGGGSARKSAVGIPTYTVDTRSRSRFRQTGSQEIARVVAHREHPRGMSAASSRASRSAAAAPSSRCRRRAP